ncbi:vanadium-dependent haloperoxidase [Algoriphagus sp. AK58]|uniref:vanadium-dependent haloperoxidase n=1 Tax=Algoriphagus sp. AK58 TaxID=1406877 RepID=UPI00164FA93E|nr:vanadium-dependent haloperoxidase [Algoriphagus sp. AK58]MBC6368619.1 haloperoxidase [Algoriphagus sp. AK58]
MKEKLILSWLYLFFILTSPVWAQKSGHNWAKIYSQELFRITEVMVTDVASPPVAARIYSYSTLGAYVTVLDSNPDLRFKDFLAFGNFPKPDFPFLETEIQSHEFAAVYAMFLVGEKIMPSGYLLKEAKENWIKKGLKEKIISKKNLDTHLQLAQKAADFVLDLARKDGYIQLTALTRYTPKEGEGFWFPTPPAYMAAVEPEWRTMKTFYLQNLEDFKPSAMAPFDLNEGSSFQIQLQEVYQVGKSLTEEQKLIANFWDCNPFKVEFSGHMAIGVKKISPGGHWIGITGIASEKANLSFAETAYIHALIGTTLHDAFVSCWKAKYDTNRIRPETVIHQKLDSDWKPLLQTPPFPEYTSGHSVISSASAEILTGYFGDSFDFVDSSEVYFGLPERAFSSFYQAAEEASISRLYGGIHFRDAIENGVAQGKKIGKTIWDRLD